MIFVTPHTSARVQHHSVQNNRHLIYPRVFKRTGKPGQKKKYSMLTAFPTPLEINTFSGSLIFPDKTPVRPLDKFDNTQIFGWKSQPSAMHLLTRSKARFGKCRVEDCPRNRHTASPYSEASKKMQRQHCHDQPLSKGKRTGKHWTKCAFLQPYLFLRITFAPLILTRRFRDHNVGKHKP